MHAVHCAYYPKLTQFFLARAIRLVILIVAINTDQHNKKKVAITSSRASVAWNIFFVDQHYKQASAFGSNMIQ